MSGTKRRNFRRDCPEAEKEWRKRCRYGEAEYRYGKKYGKEYSPFNHDGTTREAVAEELAEGLAGGDGEGGDGTDRLLERPRWQVESGEWIWHARDEWWAVDEDGETDWTASPVENEVACGDYEAVIRRKLSEAAALRTRDRFPALSRLEDEAEERCSLDFAERLHDAICAKYPDFQAYCLRRVEGYHQRGRKPSQASKDAA